jgi:sortase (surface protein transpeptidase)
VVIAGHVDSATQGGGAFFRLRDLRPGDEVTVAGSDGATRTFSVVSREVFEKAAVPLDQLFARDGPPRLTLITCGGAFDASSRHYRDNVVVTAQPV